MNLKFSVRMVNLSSAYIGRAQFNRTDGRLEKQHRTFAAYEPEPERNGFRDSGFRRMREPEGTIVERNSSLTELD